MKRLRILLLIAAVISVTSAGWTYYRNSTAATALATAAEGFLDTLSAEQRTIAQLPYEAPQRLQWHFIPLETRKGLQLRDMTESQQAAAHALLRSALSQLGYEKATRIMSLESLLHELEGANRRFARDPLRYYFTVFGDPASTAKWGLSIEGHHLSFNFVVEGDQVVSSTPQVFCTNPAEVKNENQTGIPVGTRILKDEEALAFELVNSLTSEQKQAAIFDATALKEVREPGTPQPPQEPAIGLAAEHMTAAQQKLLRSLLEVYAGAMPAEVADARLAAIDSDGLGTVHFAWAGATEPGIGHYYRLQGPSFVLEFVNTQPDAAGNKANHIHTLWRDMHGDFGVPLQ
ncbi:MAG: DUF3500 domain-containing protein [Planctomycetaceae bacterium]|nr:DUF3500 domain-containing protein [Planctomycetaceae bacterium]